jgi:sulfur dioxygenase
MLFARPQGDSQSLNWRVTGMIFRQLFDSVSGTYTYLIASRRGGEALIVDPVLEKVDRYIQLVGELDLKLVKAVDTHLHADHLTGLGALRDRTHCVTVMGERSKVDVVSMRLSEGDKLTIEGVALDVLYTPGHTDDSYSFLMRDRVFTGDTLLIRGTGRTDFQNGDPRAQYDSIFNKLLRLPDETMIFPAHDYKGETVSTIGEEKMFNPRLQVKSVDQYVELMNNLNLPNPKMMDVAVPANMRVGLAQEEIARRGWAVSAAAALALNGRPDVALVDLRSAANARSTASLPARCTPPTPISRPTSDPAAWCMNSPAPPASASSSIAPSANARPWRCRPRRTLASHRPVTSRAASTPGRKRAGRSCTSPALPEKPTSAAD